MFITYTLEMIDPSLNFFLLNTETTTKKDSMKYLITLFKAVMFFFIFDNFVSDFHLVMLSN